MKSLTTSFLLFAILTGVAGVGLHVLSPVWADDATTKTKKTKKTIMEVSKSKPEQPKSAVTKTDEEWAKSLTPDQYRILRKAGTERAGGKVYKEFKEQGEGTYYCAGCNAELFSSKEKFDARCGWPSFYDPSKAKNVEYKTDFDLGYVRTEVRCKVCDGHLGHVFTGEGFETPTDKRYCINGTVLKFVPKKVEPEEAAKDETKESVSEKKSEEKK